MRKAITKAASMEVNLQCKLVRKAAYFTLNRFPSKPPGAKIIQEADALLQSLYARIVTSPYTFGGTVTFT